MWKKSKKIFSSILIFVFLLQQLFFFVPTAKAATNFTNTGFESDLSNWSPTYSLLDQFDTAVAAGSVNGTSAEPTGGVRTAADTNSKLSITGGLLNFVTGGSANGDPGLWHPGVTRAAGITLLGTLNGTNSNYTIGWDTNQSGALTDAINFVSGTGIRATSPNTVVVAPTTPSSGVDVNTAAVLRSSGSYNFVRESTAYPTWTLLWISSTGTTGTMYPAVTATGLSAVFAADNIRIPTSTFIPTPTAYDTFTTASSTSTETTGPDSQTVTSLPWTGSTWTVTGGSVSNTPTQGSELISNGDMETGNPPTGWAQNGTLTTFAQSTEQAHGGSNSLKMVTSAVTSGAQQSITQSAGTWVVWSSWIYPTIETAYALRSTSLSIGILNKTLTLNQWNNLLMTDRVTVANPNTIDRATNSGSTFYLDDVSIKPLTTSSLFRSLESGSADALVESAVTGPTSTSGIQGGLVLNLDSTTNPQNFIIVYLDGAGNIKVDESVAGVYTNKASTAVTYSAGATLRAIKYGNSLDVYYNNAKVGSTLTMTANTNTKHGLFSTSSTNTFDNFAVWPRSGYNLPDFVVSRDTTTTYGGSTGSAKLVGGANAATFTQSVNTGDASRYTLSTYAYTDGSAVTSSDLSLYGNGSAVPTTYTSVGGGWYQLTGTVTGNTSAVDYGVQVQAGKTVYVDNMNLGIVPLTSGGGGTTCTDTAPASAPTVTSVIPTANSIQLLFTKAADPVSYYALEYGTKSGEYIYGSSNIGDSNTTSYTINLLNPNTAYYFRVRAGNGCTPGAWSNEYSAKTSSLTGAFLPVEPTTQILVPVVPLPAPAPTVSPTPPEPSPTPISFVWPTIQWPQISWPTITLPTIVWPVFTWPSLALPQISLPSIAFSFPRITLPVIAIPTISLPSISFTFPTFTLPSIAINLTPISNFFALVFSWTGNTAKGFIVFVQESIAYADYISSERYKNQAKFYEKISDWLVYTGISFNEIVLDEEPTRITDVSIKDITPTSAIITWKTNHLSNSKVNYGETLSYGLNVLSDEKVHDHVLTITDLKPGTRYVFEVMSQNKTYVFDAWHEFTTSNE